MPDETQTLKDLKDVLQAGLAAADPRDAVLRSLDVDPENGHISAAGESFAAERVFVLAAGKAAGAMARAATELLGDKVSGGLVVAKAGQENSVPEGLETIYASHPEPDEHSIAAARRVEELVEPLGEGDLLLALVSGGASALLADPAGDVELEDLKELTGALLRSGADISEINTVRKHISFLKGGGLVRLASPAPTLALLLSDVVGDDPSSIASGLTAPDPTTLEEVRSILERYGIDPPENIADHLKESGENPSSGDVRDSAFEKVTNVVCGGGRLSSGAAVDKARELGYAPLLLSTSMTGEARGIAAVYGAVIRECLETGEPASPPCAFVSGGEATVTILGEGGKGGPNEEFALQLALELEGVEGWSAFAVDTDGNDGSTDAAGALVTGGTAAGIREAGLDPDKALENNDAYPALEAADALLITGPTGTNVNDLRVALVDTGTRRR